jgi:hypothetical protein
VSFTDGSDASGLPVTLLGAVGKRITTGSGGSYSFDALPKGVYQVSVEGTDTRERRLSFGTESDGSTAVTAPELSFSPVGSLTGKVMTAAGPASDVTVYLSGSDRVSLTDAAGVFGFFEVPAGDYTLVAKARGAVAQQATAMVKVKRGKNEAMPLTLANDLSVTGKVEGTLALFNGGSPKDIKVSVADISAMTADNGSFTLTLPPGDYMPVAELAGYPKQSLGLVTVRTGQTTTLPVKTLSLYKAFPWGSVVSSAAWTAVSEGDIALLAVSVSADYATEHYFFDTKTFERKLYAIGSIGSQALSKNGKWVAFVPSNGNGVVAINSATGQTHSFGAPSITAGPVISNDEGTMMYQAGAPQNSLVRVDLATGATTSFPAFSSSYFQTNERFLARTTSTSPFDVQLITLTSATTVFNNMTTLVNLQGVAISTSTTGYQVMLAYNCPPLVNCNVQVLGPAATNSSQITTAITSAPSQIPGSVKDWLGLTWSGGKALVKVSDGSTTNLPANTQALFFNETLARVVTYSLDSSSNYEVREDVVPPNPSSTVHMVAPSSPQGSWLSPSRFMAFGSGTTKRVDIKNGVATVDNDVTLDFFAQSPSFFPPGVLWIKATTMKRAAAIYDSGPEAPDTLGITASLSFSSVGSKTGVRTGLLGRFAAFSDGATMFVLDAMTAGVKKVGVGVPSALSTLFVPTDRMRVTRLGGIELQFFESGRLVSLSEPGQSIASGGVASLPKSGGTVAVAVDANDPKDTLYFAVVP